MKIFKAIYYIFIGFIALVALLLVVSIFPVTGNYKLMVVQSGSMEPAIKMGSLVVVKPVGEYKINDVITFIPPGSGKKSVSHRIFSTETQNGEQVFVTKGDANNSPDQGIVRRSEITGKVLFNIPYVGYLIEVAKKPYGFLALIIIPALIIVSDQVKNIYVEMKKIRESKKIAG